MSASFWNAERVERLLTLTAEGVKQVEIGRILTEETGVPVTEGMIASKLKRLREGKTESGSKGFDWRSHPEADTFLREHWAKGWTASKIADELSRIHGFEITRGGVLGRKDRLGLPNPASKLPVLRLQPKSKKRRPLRPQVIDPPSVNKRRSILDLYDIPELPKLCRWIVGDSRKPLEAIYCGAKTFSGCYCHQHWERSLTPEARARLAAKLKHAA